jgi:hypothetical protein
MYFSGGPAPHRRPDEEALAEFGEPIFELVAQPRLQQHGWELDGENNVTVAVGTNHWLADADGDFHFIEYPTGPYGTFLLGRIYTEVPGASMQPDTDDIGGALIQHLNHVVLNHRINDSDFSVPFGSDEWHDETFRWYAEIRALSPLPGSLVIDGETVEAQSISYGGCTATATRIQGRVVTLIMADDIAGEINTNIVSRQRHE